MGISQPTVTKLIHNGKLRSIKNRQNPDDWEASRCVATADGEGRAMTQPTSERDRVKQRLAKLLNMTLDNGASENEAMMAADKAAELMAFYDIEASELSVRSARAIKQTVRARKYGNMIIGAPVARHIAQLCDCM
jgi:hypothetical protein